MPLMKMCATEHHPTACRLNLDFLGTLYLKKIHLNISALACHYPAAEGVTPIKAPIPRSNVSHYPPNTRNKLLFTTAWKVSTPKTQIVLVETPQALYCRSNACIRALLSFVKEVTLAGVF